MQEIVITTTKARQIINITEEVQRLVPRLKIEEGVCNLFVLHTTAALITADLDPDTTDDFLDAFEALIPKLQYRHRHNPGHVKDHIISSMLGPSLCVPIEKGELMLGAWQKIMLVELGGPRERNIVISFLNTIQ